jgi:hypothetical protein
VDLVHLFAGLKYCRYLGSLIRSELEAVDVERHAGVWRGRCCCCCAVVSGLEGAGCGGVVAPCGAALLAADFVGSRSSAISSGRLVGGGAFSLVVHRLGSVVVGEDLTEVVGRGVNVAAAQVVDLRLGGRRGVFLGFTGDVLVDEGFIGVSAAGHGDVGHGAGGVLAQDRVGGVGGDALGGVHGGGMIKRRLSP